MRDERLVPDEGSPTLYYIQAWNREGATIEFPVYCYEHELEELVEYEVFEALGHENVEVEFRVMAKGEDVY